MNHLAIAIAMGIGLSCHAQVQCDMFKVHAALNGHTLTLSLETDLPGEAELMMSVDRSRWDVGDSAEYSLPYFSDRTTVREWRRPRELDVRDDIWHRALSKNQTMLARAGMPYTVRKIDDQIEIDFVLHINQSDPRFGKGNKDLTGTQVESTGLRVIRSEVRLYLPLGMTGAETQPSPSPPLDAANSVGKVVAQILGGESTGTGVLTVLHDGVLTNAHVVQGASVVKFTPKSTENPIPVRIAAIWPDIDLALLVPLSDSNAFLSAGMTPAPVSITDPTAGETVHAIGFPLGLGFTITRGVISGMSVFRELPTDFQSVDLSYRPESKWVRTDCAINPGNSGGPLFNDQNEVVGLNTWGSTVHNDVYFAIAMSEIDAAITDRALKTGPTTNPKATPVRNLDGTRSTDLIVGIQRAVAQGDPVIAMHALSPKIQASFNQILQSVADGIPPERYDLLFNSIRRALPVFRDKREYVVNYLEAIDLITNETGSLSSFAAFYNSAVLLIQSLVESDAASYSQLTNTTLDTLISECGPAAWSCLMHWTSFMFDQAERNMLAYEDQLTAPPMSVQDEFNSWYAIGRLIQGIQEMTAAEISQTGDSSVIYIDLPRISDAFDTTLDLTILNRFEMNRIDGYWVPAVLSDDLEQLTSSTAVASMSSEISRRVAIDGFYSLEFLQTLNESIEELAQSKTRAEFNVAMMPVVRLLSSGRVWSPGNPEEINSDASNSGELAKLPIKDTAKVVSETIDKAISSAGNSKPILDVDTFLSVSPRALENAWTIRSDGYQLHPVSINFDRVNLNRSGKRRILARIVFSRYSETKDKRLLPDEVYIGELVKTGKGRSTIQWSDDFPRPLTPFELAVLDSLSTWTASGPKTDELRESDEVDTLTVNLDLEYVIQ